jgi:hypothetical protein
LPAWTDICSSAIAPALLYYRPSMALCNICIDLQGWRKCRKIAGSNRGHHIPVDYVGKGREHDCMDAGGRAMHGAIAESNAGAVAEERKLCLPMQAPKVGALGGACTPAIAISCEISNRAQVRFVPQQPSTMYFNWQTVWTSLGDQYEQ